MSKDENKFLINDPHALKPGQKITAVGVTLLFWGALLYLLQPIISLIAWWFNIKLFYNHMILLGGYEALLDVMKFYTLMIVLLGGGLIFWARINQWRFKSNNSRNFSDHVNDKKIHEYFDTNAEKLTYLQCSTNVKVRLNKSGGILDFKD